MRALWLLKNGGLEALSVRESAEPLPQDGEVRVRVHAAGLNFAEILMRQGLYPEGPELPAVLGFEAAGVVEAVRGPSDGLKPGARVVVRSGFRAHAEYVCVPAASVFPLPESMTFAEAVAFPVSYVTAYYALFRTAHLRSGDWVLIHAAGGGVGLAAVQLCRTVAGVTVIGTASRHKHRALFSQGCDYLIDYHSEDYADEIRRLGQGRGVDIVLDPLGGSDTLKNYELLGPDGRLVCYGFLNLVCGERRDVRHVAHQIRTVPLLNPRDLINSSRSVAGLNLSRLDKRDPSIRRATIDALFGLYQDGKIRPVIDEQYQLERASRGYNRLQRGENLGKIVVNM